MVRAVGMGGGRFSSVGSLNSGRVTGFRKCGGRCGEQDVDGYT